MTTTNEHVLVNPVTQPVIAPFNGAPRLASLAGTRLGLIDDSKRNADVLLEELAGVAAHPLRDCQRKVAPQAQRLAARRPRCPQGTGRRVRFRQSLR